MDFKAHLEWPRQLISAESSMKGGLKKNVREHKYQKDLDRMSGKMMMA